MEDQNPSTLTKAIEKAAEGLRSTAAGLEEAAKQMGEMQNAVSPNAVKQLDRIEELLNRIPADLPEKLEMIDKFIKLIPIDLDKQLERLEFAIDELSREATKQVTRMDSNNVYRMHNSRLFSGDVSLKPLLNMRGEKIGHFPRTATHLHALGTEAINALCQELGMIPNEDPATTKKNVLEFIGCGKFELGI